MLKKRIKKLAKKSLKEKWYPIRDGKKGVNRGDDCAFCIDANKRSGNKKHPRRGACSVCYCPRFICNQIGGKNDVGIDTTIKRLEQLARKGKLS